MMAGAHEPRIGCFGISNYPNLSQNLDPENSAAAFASVDRDTATGSGEVDRDVACGAHTQGIESPLEGRIGSILSCGDQQLATRLSRHFTGVEKRHRAFGSSGWIRPIAQHVAGGMSEILGIYVDRDFRRSARLASRAAALCRGAFGRGHHSRGAGDERFGQVSTLHGPCPAKWMR